MEKVKLSVVSYLNSEPFRNGLTQPFIANKITVSNDIPSLCAQKLLSNEVDLGLVPVAVIPSLKEAHIISDYCISSTGKVDSVCLYSKVPLGEIDTILLDYQSKTSVTLVKILAKKRWNINPKWENARTGFENKIDNNTAAVIIGDRTFGLAKSYEYVYDLSAEWEKLTQLPFVFACWVANKQLNDRFISTFNKALNYGVTHLDETIKNASLNTDLKTNIAHYFKHCIEYDYTAKKKEGLQLFLQLKQELGL